MITHSPFDYQRTSTDFDRELRGEYRLLHDKGLGLDCTYNKPQLERLDLSKERPIHWLWQDKIPLGKLTLIEGPPAVGKLFVALDIAARVTTGELCGKETYSRWDLLARLDNPQQKAASQETTREETTREEPGQKDRAGAEAEPAERPANSAAATPNPPTPSEACIAAEGPPKTGPAPLDLIDLLRSEQLLDRDLLEMDRLLFQQAAGASGKRQESAPAVENMRPAPARPAEPFPELPAVSGHPVVLICDSWQAKDMLSSRLKGLGANDRLLVVFTEVNGTDQCRSHQHSRPIRFPIDLPMLEYILRQNRGCRLIVIDNLESYCESPRQLRQAIQELENAAIYFDIAIVAIVQDNVRFHPDGTIRDTARTTDGPARCIWCLTPDATRPGLLRLEPKRMTICKKTEGIACRISDAGQVVWEPLPPYEKPPTTAARQKQQEQARMRMWLETTLGSEIVRAETIYEAGREQGFSKNRLIAARIELGARTFKTGFGKTGVWMWTLKPEAEINEAEAQIASIGLPPDDFDELNEALEREFPDDGEDEEVEVEDAFGEEGEDETEEEQEEDELERWNLGPEFHEQIVAQETENFRVLNENGRKMDGSESSSTHGTGPHRDLPQTPVRQRLKKLDTPYSSETSNAAQESEDQDGQARSAASAAQKSENSGVLNKNGRKMPGSGARRPRIGKDLYRITPQTPVRQRLKKLDTPYALDFPDVSGIDLGGLTTAQLREIGMKMLGLPPLPRPGTKKEQKRPVCNGHSGNGPAGNGHSGNGHSQP